MVVMEGCKGVEGVKGVELPRYQGEQHLYRQAVATERLPEAVAGLSFVGFACA
jgi:hypothetical protein